MLHAPPSPLNGKPILLGFDGADMSSDAGLTLLREIERKAGLAQRLADCLCDPRDPAKVRHSLCDIIRFRIMMIGAGYEDGNDATALRHDPSFRIALERGPDSGPALCSQPTISPMENLPDARALIRMGRAMVWFYCQSFARAPGRIVLDIDDTFDAVHGHQQLRLFNAFYDEFGFQPIVIFDGKGRLVGTLLRPARRPMLLTNDPNEVAAIWCLLSIGILLLVVKTPIRQFMFVKSWWLWPKQIVQKQSDI